MKEITETHSKNNKSVKIVIAVIAVVMIAIFGLIFFKSQNTNDNVNEQIAELENKEASLKAKQNVVFRTEGFSEEYYRLNNEISHVQDEIWDLESQQRKGKFFGTVGVFMLIPIIIFAIVVITIITSIIKMSKISKHQIVHPSERVGHEMEKMASMMGKVAAEMAKEMNPEYKTLTCPNCGANLKDDVDKCEYCDAPLIKVAASRKK